MQPSMFQLRRQLEADGVTIVKLTNELKLKDITINMLDTAWDQSIEALAAAQAEIARLTADRAAASIEYCELMDRHDAEFVRAEAAEAALATAREDDGNPRPIETAPKDGTMLRLLVDYEGVENWMPLTDDNQSWTIGFNDLQNIGEDEWVFVGWNWSQDCFGTGEGKVIGWLPFDAIKKGAAT